ncbi:hypothetical protein K1719_022260 [Acacia pycnantha]|nr:hypothetical protein K1719_022260 [Acacia pycnantha]
MRLAFSTLRIGGLSFIWALFSSMPKPTASEANQDTNPAPRGHHIALFSNAISRALGPENEQQSSCLDNANQHLDTDANQRGRDKFLDLPDILNHSVSLLGQCGITPTHTRRDKERRGIGMVEKTPLLEV